MKMKQFHSVTSLIFLVLGVAHFVRAINASQVTVGTMVVPVWISWVAAVVGIYLAYQAYKLRS